jgi:hypothetical protein
MRALDWSEIFYKNQCELKLTDSLRKFHDSNIGIVNWKIRPTLKKIYEIFVKDMTLNHASMIANLNDFVHSSFASIFNSEKSAIDFIEAQQEGDFIYIVVNTDTYLDASVKIIKFILLDLMYASNQVQGGYYKKKFYPIYLDEFADFVVPGFESFLKKCGSAGYCIHLACQSFGDLRDKKLEDFILSNTYNHLVLRQSYPINADLASKLFGTFTSKKETYKFNEDEETGEKSVREVEELLVNPNLIKRLDNGKGIFTNNKKLHYLELPTTPFYTLGEEASYITLKEKDLFIKELKKTATIAKARCEEKRYNDLSAKPKSSTSSIIRVMEANHETT